MPGYSATMRILTDFLDWLASPLGRIILTSAVLPFIAIVLAGFIAALIGRSFAKRVIALSDREVKASAVTALISAARKAAVWNTLPAPEQLHVDHLIGDADIRLRLLPVAGTALAADWARHEINDMKRNAVSFSFQAEQSLIVFRDRLIDWQSRPSRAKRLFKNDLDSWAYDSSLSEQELVHQQQEWAASQIVRNEAAAQNTPVAESETPIIVTAPLAPAVVVSPAARTGAGADFLPSRFTRPAPTNTAATPAATQDYTAQPQAAQPEAAQHATNSAHAMPAARDEPQRVEPQLVEPRGFNSLRPRQSDGHDKFEGTPAFIQPENDAHSDAAARDALPEIVIHDDSAGTPPRTQQ